MKYLLLLALTIAMPLSAQTYVLLENDLQEKITYFGMKQTPGGDAANLLSQPLGPGHVHVEQSGIPDGTWNFYLLTESQYAYSYENVVVSCSGSVCTLVLRATDFPAVLAPPPTAPPEPKAEEEEEMACSTGGVGGHAIPVVLAILAAIISIRRRRW